MPSLHAKAAACNEDLGRAHTGIEKHSHKRYNQPVTTELNANQCELLLLGAVAPAG